MNVKNSIFFSCQSRLTKYCGIFSKVLILIFKWGLDLSPKFCAMHQPDTSLKPGFIKIKEIATPSIVFVMCTIYNKHNQ